jgi:hypothetical protein
VPIAVSVIASMDFGQGRKTCCYALRSPGAIEQLCPKQLYSAHKKANLNFSLDVKRESVVYWYSIQ